MECIDSADIEIAIESAMVTDDPRVAHWLDAFYKRCIDKINRIDIVDSKLLQNRNKNANNG